MNSFFSIFRLRIYYETIFHLLFMYIIILFLILFLKIIEKTKRRINQNWNLYRKHWPICTSMDYLHRMLWTVGTSPSMVKHISHIHIRNNDTCGWIGCLFLVPSVMQHLSTCSATIHYCRIRCRTLSWLNFPCHFSSCQMDINFI